MAIIFGYNITIPSPSLSTANRSTLLLFFIHVTIVLNLIDLTASLPPRIGYGYTRSLQKGIKPYKRRWDKISSCWGGCRRQAEFVWRKLWAALWIANQEIWRGIIGRTQREIFWIWWLRWFVARWRFRRYQRENQWFRGYR